MNIINITQQVGMIKSFQIKYDDYGTSPKHELLDEFFPRMKYDGICWLEQFQRITENWSYLNEAVALIVEHIQTDTAFPTIEDHCLSIIQRAEDWDWCISGEPLYNIIWASSEKGVQMAIKKNITCDGWFKMAPYRVHQAMTLRNRKRDFPEWLIRELKELRQEVETEWNGELGRLWDNEDVRDMFNSL